MIQAQDGGGGPKPPTNRKPRPKPPTNRKPRPKVSVVPVPKPKPRSIDKPVLKAQTKKPVEMRKALLGRDKRKPPGERMTTKQYQKLTPAQKKKLAQANADWYFPRV